MLKSGCLSISYILIITEFVWFGGSDVWPVKISNLATFCKVVVFCKDVRYAWDFGDSQKQQINTA